MHADLVNLLGKELTDNKDENHQSHELQDRMDDGKNSGEENKGQNEKKWQPKKHVLCDKCGRFYSRFSQHENSHRQMRRFECEFCDKLFLTKHNLERHYLVHTGDKKFSCDLCGKKFGQRVSLHRHQKNVHKLETVVCDICSKTFQTDQSLQNHKKIVHFAGALCDKTFQTNQSSQNDTHGRKRRKPFGTQDVCKICERIYLGRHGLRDHMRRDHNVGRPMPTCYVCDKKYKCASVLEKHMASHEEKASQLPTRKTRKCLLCKLVFHTGSELRRHRRVCPLNMFHCYECGRGFSRVSLLTRHMSGHLNAGHHRHITNQLPSMQRKSFLIPPLVPQDKSIKHYSVTHEILENIKKENSMYTPNHRMKLRDRSFVNYNADEVDDFDFDL